MKSTALQRIQSTEQSHHTLRLALSPSRHVYLYESHEVQDGIISQEDDIAKIKVGFDINPIIGLLRLGILAFNSPLPPCFTFWQRFTKLFIAEVSKSTGTSSPTTGIQLPPRSLHDLLEQAPFMRGSEYLNESALQALWQDLEIALQEELVAFKGELKAYLSHYNPAWHHVGRICFHLAENKNNPQYPFAFLATYTTRLSSTTGVQHLPLERALKEYAGEEQRAQLLSLLIPVQRAAEHSPFIKTLVDTGAIFRPLPWQASDAYQFLQATALIEEAGVMVRVPNWWNKHKPPRPKVKIAIGNDKASAVGVDAMLDFDIQYALPNGEELTYEELMTLINSPHHLVQVKGQWVEVDPEKLNAVLSHWQKLERQVKRDGLTFAEGLRLLAGSAASQGAMSIDENIVEWSKIEEGPWLGEKLSQLRHPDTIENSLQKTLEDHLKATLRPYQQQGVQWLWWLYNLRLGGCLADDMGLGKTIQVLSLLILAKHLSQEQHRPSLLILPASLLGNWQGEINRFAPHLSVLIAHRSVNQLEGISLEEKPDLSGIDLVMTTYAYAHRLSWLSDVSWNLIILDEAQGIKNPGAKQTQAIKKLKGQVRLALTGTPVENSLLDLWSLFDFVAPGLLGSSKAFAQYNKKSTQEHQDSGRFYATVRHLVSPYILRRLKSDKSIIADLPDKTEIDTYCLLTKQQVVLYEKALKELKEKLEEKIEGIKRNGIVLSFLMRFKQICNHPDQWLGHGEFGGNESGKFLRLRELCEEIAAKQEKVLIFTQFREIIPAISQLLESVFERPGLILHGQTPIKERAKLVEAFQEDQGPPFFVLSLKAGGTGLTLTKASHVIHFDRWWNPAVENQATDRAYRIGQQKNVLVHKFICQGTIEEKIDKLIKSKRDMADQLLSHENEVNLATLSDDELLEAVALDIHRALAV